MLAPVTNGLPGSVRTDYVTYSATAFPWESNVYAKSKQQAVDNARGMIGAMAASCGETRFAIVGYSQAPTRQVISPPRSEPASALSPRLASRASACCPIPVVPSPTS